jgi:hypothetical protein
MLQALNSEMLAVHIRISRFELTGADPFDDLNWLVDIRQYDTLQFSFQDS